jgi:hypothetical protein
MLNDVLKEIFKSGVKSYNEISSALNISDDMLAHTINNLERMGYLSRESEQSGDSCTSGCGGCTGCAVSTSQASQSSRLVVTLKGIEKLKRMS